MSLAENPTDKQKLNEDEIEEIVTNMAKKETIDDDVLAEASLEEPTEEELALREIEHRQTQKKQQTETMEEPAEEEKQGRKAKGKEMPIEKTKLTESKRKEIREDLITTAENQPQIVGNLIKYWLEEGDKCKAATLLAALETERASIILQNFKENEIEEIVSEMMKEDTVDGEMLDKVFKEAYTHIYGEESVRISERLEGGAAYVKQLLSASLGEVKGRDMMARLGIAEARTFDFITDYELDDVANFLEYMLETMGRVRVRDVEKAQQRILKVAKELTDEGIISLAEEDYI